MQKERCGTETYFLVIVSFLTVNATTLLGRLHPATFSLRPDLMRVFQEGGHLMQERTNIQLIEGKVTFLLLARRGGQACGGVVPIITAIGSDR